MTETVQWFQTKSVKKQAIQLKWQNWNAICEFVPRPWFVRGVWLDKNGNPLPEDKWRFGENNDDLGLIMRTLESNEYLAKGNDWIIKGVKGEFYACKPDIFAATYEAVDSPAPSQPEASAEQRAREWLEKTPTHHAYCKRFGASYVDLVNLLAAYAAPLEAEVERLQEKAIEILDDHQKQREQRFDAEQRAEAAEAALLKQK